MKSLILPLNRQYVIQAGSLTPLTVESPRKRACGSEVSYTCRRRDSGESCVWQRAEEPLLPSEAGLWLVE